MISLLISSYCLALSALCCQSFVVAKLGFQTLTDWQLWSSFNMAYHALDLEFVVLCVGFGE